MKIFYAGREETDNMRGPIWDLLCACDAEFYPPLSQRSSSSQKELVTELNAKPEGPVAYFNEMIRQEFILAVSDGRLAGFMTFKKDYICDALKDLGISLYITTVCVDESFRHRGILSMLYDCMENEVAPSLGYSAVSTRTWSLNETQIHSLSKRAYTLISVLKDDLGPGVDTLYYGLRCKKPDHGSLYIMRHGKTDWNVMHKLQGQTDIPLNEEGIAMAKEAALNCRDTHFDICFCSPLIRARMTAKTVLKDRDIPVVYDDRLKEMCFGEYEGIENSFDIRNCNVNVLFFHPDRYTADRGAESLDALMARTAAFLDEQVYPLIAKGKDVLIIGHGAMNSSIVCQVLKMPLADFWKKGIENCRLMKLI